MKLNVNFTLDVIQQKLTMQKNFDAERNELMQSKLNLEQKLKKNSDELANDKLEAHVQYEKLQQAHKLLQSEHKLLVEDCAKSKQAHLEEVNALNHKLQDILSKTQKEQNVLNSEIAMLKEKYKTLLNDKEHTDTVENKSRLLQLEHILNEYQAHCSYQPKAVSSLAHLQINKPIDIPQIVAANSSPQTAEQKKSFSHQVRVGDGRYNINLNINQTLSELTANGKSLNTTSTTGYGTSTTTLSIPFAVRQNRSLILNSVENFQILPKMLNKIKPESQTQKIDKIASPLGAPHKLTSSSESNKHLLEVATNAPQSSSSTSSLPPLPVPPQQQRSQEARKLPENVAPIPDNFEALFKNDDQQQKVEEKAEAEGVSNKQVVETQGAANVPDKAEKVAKMDDGNNNRYANVVNDMGSNARPENAAYINAKDFNVPANNEDENNFFEAAESKNIANAAAANGNNEAEGEALAEAGDLEVKNKKVLDTDNVNNEVAGDQGKEFDDGLRLEEGMEEDEDDDYSNLARQNGEQAIRN